MTIHIPFFFVNRYELAVKWLRANLRRVSVCLLCRATWVRFPPGAETLFSIFTAILHGNEPVSEITRVLSYCWAFFSRIPSVVISSRWSLILSMTYIDRLISIVLEFLARESGPAPRLANSLIFILSATTLHLNM